MGVRFDSLESSLVRLEKRESPLLLALPSRKELAHSGVRFGSESRQEPERSH